MVRSSSIRAGLAQRARIVLLAAEGLANAEIARRTGTSRPTVVDWRARYDAGGIAALHDQPRSGRPPKIDDGIWLQPLTHPTTTSRTPKRRHTAVAHRRDMAAHQSGRIPQP